MEKQFIFGIHFILGSDFADVTSFMQYFNISMSYREDADIRDAITLINNAMMFDVKNSLT